MGAEEGGGGGGIQSKKNDEIVWLKSYLQTGPRLVVLSVVVALEHRSLVAFLFRQTFALFKIVPFNAAIVTIVFLSAIQALIHSLFFLCPTFSEFFSSPAL